jgi:hypothetical protein
MAQARQVLGVVLLAACGGSQTGPAPASPEAAVRGFMDAVQSSSLVAMGNLWGSERGPARTYMPVQELEQRLTIIRTYLAHEQFEVLPAAASLSPGPEHVVEVRLTRKGCTPVVPFTLVRYGQGWLISRIDIAAAGNPERPCRPPAP